VYFLEVKKNKSGKFLKNWKNPVQDKDNFIKFEKSDPQQNTLEREM
jgi:hypothetical protein